MSRDRTMTAPRVSVVICVYNGEKFVGRAIDSALAQGFDGAEVVVVDDGSTDGTSAILARYGDRIRVVRQGNRGLAASRNVGVQASRAEYVAFLDADDVWLAGRLAKTVGALDRNPAAVLAFSDTILLDYSDTPLGLSLLEAGDQAHAPSMEEMLERFWPIQPSAVTMRRAAIEKCGGFREEYRSASGFEDVYLFLLAREQGPFEYVPEPLVRYRILPLIDRLEKYAPGFRLFSRHVRERYGATAELIPNYIALHSDLLIRRGMGAMGRGDLKQARRAFRCLMLYKPATRRDIFRLLRTYLPRPLAVALTSRSWRQRAITGAMAADLRDDY
jgi:glycosyltransferase involved in cell wall biosynthesis